MADTVVNQLLSMIDGVNMLNNVLLFGLTNRKDLIDDAILRPGRFEVHIEIGLPDEPGREQIFMIHTRKARAAGIVSPDVNFGELAALAKNYTGAEIEGVVQCARALAMEGFVDSVTHEPIPGMEPRLEMKHFREGLTEIRPAFGVEEKWKDVFDVRGMARIDDAFGRLFDHLQASSGRFRKGGVGIWPVMISGARGCGASSLAYVLATSYACVRVIAPCSFTGKHEDQVAGEIGEIFETVYRSAESAIVIDNVEDLCEFSALGMRYSNKVVHAIRNYLARGPPAGHILAVFVTCHNRHVCEDLGFATGDFVANIALRALSSSGEIAIVAKECLELELGWSEADRAEADVLLLSHAVPVKRVVAVLTILKKDGDVKWPTFRGEFPELAG